MNIDAAPMALDRFGYEFACCVISTVWQSLIVLSAFGGLAFLVRKRAAKVRHAIWTAAILSLPLIPVVSYVIASNDFRSKPIQVLPAYPSAAVTGDISKSSAIAPPAIVEKSSPATEKTINSTNPDRGNGYRSLGRSPWTLAPLLYLLGAGVLLLRRAAGRVRVKRMIREGIVITEGRVFETCEEIRGLFGLKRAFVIVESGDAPVPFTCRVVHPALVIPSGFADSLSDEELRAVIAHEAAHVKRNDALTLAATSFVHVLFFFQPLVWYAVREVSSLAEQDCDTAALEASGSPVSYARLLTRIAETAVANPRMIEYATGLIFSRETFLRRVEAVLSHRPGAMKRLSRLSLTGVVIVGLIALIAAFVLPIVRNTTPRSSVTFVSVPGGKFQMGGIVGADKENEPVHSVMISSFEMSAYEITNAQYAKYLNEALASSEVTVTTVSVKGAEGAFSGQEYIYFTNVFSNKTTKRIRGLRGNNIYDWNTPYSSYNKCWIKYGDGKFTVSTGKENWPVVYVTWYGAKAFALHYGWDLPTEAEWEFACRGGKQYQYGTYDGKINSKKANYGFTKTHPDDVGSYPKNPFGLYDMSGNVAEWCNDWFGEYSSESVTDPIGPQSGLYRITRGGGWGIFGGNRSDSAAGRSYVWPDFGSPGYGFRVVRRASSSGESSVKGKGTTESGSSPVEKPVRTETGSFTGKIVSAIGWMFHKMNAENVSEERPYVESQALDVSESRTISESTQVSSNSDTTPLWIGVVREDDTIVPFALFTGSGWINSWPIGRPVMPGVPPDTSLTLDGLPSRWYSPFQRLPREWLIRGTDGSLTTITVTRPITVNSHCETFVGLLIGNAKTPEDTRAPVRIMGFAASAAIITAPVESVTEGSEEWSRIFAFVQKRTDAAAAFTKATIKSYTLRLERGLPEEDGSVVYRYNIESDTEAPGRRSGETMSMRITSYGWVRSDHINTLSYCSGEGKRIGDMIPLGTFMFGGKTFWVVKYQFSESESYAVIEVGSAVKNVIDTYGGGC
jgi:formylglycine-generating enzyme required for sulfatase activity